MRSVDSEKIGLFIEPRKVCKSAGRRFNFNGSQHYIIRYGEHNITLRGQRDNHVLHCG